jgi:predicted restriction endonuclease
VCRWPGCTRSARTCDLDHIVPWPDGPTTADNLIALCRGHHRLKTLGRFSISVGEHHVAVTSAARQVYWRHRHDPV